MTAVVAIDRSNGKKGNDGELDLMVVTRSRMTATVAMMVALELKTTYNDVSAGEALHKRHDCETSIAVPLMAIDKDMQVMVSYA